MLSKNLRRQKTLQCEGQNAILYYFGFCRYKTLTSTIFSPTNLQISEVATGGRVEKPHYSKVVLGNQE